MASCFGNKLKISVFGQSHGTGIGVVMDGLPAGFRVDFDELQRFLDRRRPGGSDLATRRNEADAPKFLSGLMDGVTCGSPLCAVIENTDTRSGDYAKFWDTPRPGHADFTARLRYGDAVDMRGSGHFSGRLTAPLCIAGGVAMQLLRSHGVYVGAHLLSVGEEVDEPFPLWPAPELFASIASKTLPVLNDASGDAMRREITSAASDADSVGGVIQCAAVGLPAGLGSPMFDGVENRLAAVLFGVPAVKGLSFGSGFAGARRRGSENNDPFVIEDGLVRTEKNDAGGILGGISTGMPLQFDVAVKPTPSIGRPQRTVSLSAHTSEELRATGRHDPCVALRAVPVIEAVTATVLLDLLLEEEKWN